MGERCVEFYNGWVLEVEKFMTIQVSDFVDDYSDVLFRHYIDCSTGLRFTNDDHGRYMHLDGSPREDYTAKTRMAILHVDDGTKKVLLRHRRD